MQRGSLLRRLARLCDASQRTAQHTVSSNEAIVPQLCRMFTQGGAQEATPSAGGEEAERRKLVSSLMYRSKQRGFLELDLLVGLWAQKHLPHMDVPALRAFGEVLEIDNPDLFKWLTGQAPAEESVARNPSFQAMQADILRQLQETRPQQSATQPGKPWLRGWDDWKEQAQPAAQE